MRLQKGNCIDIYVISEGISHKLYNSEKVDDLRRIDRNSLLQIAKVVILT